MMNQEIYTTNLDGLTRLIGFGPARGNENKPPLVVILDTGEVLTCNYGIGDSVGNKADIFFPERNYILREEFERINMDYYVQRLLKDRKELVMDVGEGWEDERGFVWNIHDASFLNEQGILIEKALRILEWSDIARAKQAYDELISIHILPPNRTNEVQAPKEVIDLKNEIARLFWTETSVNKINPTTPKSPSLDQLDKNNSE